MSTSILNWYKSHYGVENISLIRNLPTFSKDSELLEVEDIKSRLQIPKDQLLFIYLGMLSNGRGIQAIIEAFKNSTDKHIAFIGYGPLTKLIQETSIVHKHIHFIQAIAPKEIQSFIRTADVGISLIENTCLSYYYCMPNKMWEYLNSCIPIIVSDFPDMGDFVKTHKVGWPAEPSVAGLKKLLSELNVEEVLNAKETIRKTSIPTWNDDKIKLTKIYELACK
ncbi:MAG: glycosyltransferase [Bacteroidetes bacterium]|nr:glycosyltransferase [Bacteroidota bacterium]